MKHLNPKAISHKPLASRGAFTLMESLLYVAIFAVIGGLLVSILTGALRIGNRDAATREVEDQARFVLQSLQRLVHDAALIDMEAGIPAGTLMLRSKEHDENDFTHVYASGGVVYIAKGYFDVSGASTTYGVSPLTNDSVSVAGLTFTRQSNPPGKDTVQIDFTVAYNTDNPTLEFSRDFRSAISRVSAAVFDTGVFPNSDDSLDVGSAGARWQHGWFSGDVTIGGNLEADSANDTFYVNGGTNNVGIGTTGPTKKLHVVGGDIYISGAGEALILKSAGGTCAEITIDDAGELVSTVVSCP